MFSQLKQVEQSKSLITKENDKLKREIESLRNESEHEMSQINDDFKRQLQQKDKAIKQLKGERDSLFEELKSSQSFSKISTQKKDITKDKFEAPPLPKYSQTISQRP